jgi:hypothetical protein
MVNSQYITDTEVVAYLNSELGELYDLMVDSSEDFYTINATGLTVLGSDPVAGTNYFTVPADFMRLRGMDMLIGGQWATMRTMEFPERNAFNWPMMVIPFGYVTNWFTLVHDRVYINPAQNAGSQQYRLWYTPSYTALASGDSLPKFMDTNGWTEFAVNGACARIQTKQDLDPSAFSAGKDAQRIRVLGAIKPRVSGPPRKAVDTRTLNANNGWWMTGWPRG